MDVSGSEITIFFILVLISGLFSSIERAIYSLPKITLKKIQAGSNSASGLIDWWENRPADFFNVLYAGNILFKIAAAVLVTPMFIHLMAHYGYPEWWGVGGAMIIISFMVLLLGEVIPNTIASHAPSLVLKILGPMMILFMKVLRPLAWLFLLTSKGLIRVMGSKDETVNTNVTEQEIREIVEAGEAAGAIEETEREMIHSIIEFGDTVVKEIMVPRVNMVCVEISTPMEEILEIMAEEKLSRLPVYDQTIDTITGILHVKNILNCWRKNIREMSAIEFIAMPYFIPETKPVSELLKEFQANRLQMAIVVDEYGGTAGLVTMEDILEEIVGEIKDEYDENLPVIKPQDDGLYLLDASLEIDTVNESLNLNLPTEDYHTIGGFLLWALKRMPHKHETLVYENLKWTVKEADRKRIYKVLLEIERPAGTDNGDESGGDEADAKSNNGN